MNLFKGVLGNIKQQSLLLSLLILMFSIILPVGVSSAAPVCARVKIEIRQELTLERQAFDAMMRISNTLDTIAIENINISVNFKDENGVPVLATSDPNNTTAKFFIKVDSLLQITDVTGLGRVEPLTTAEIHWLIIPAPGAAEGLPTGKLYFVGATLDYTIGGQPEQVITTDDFITVKPLPLLTLDYFLTKDVIADDPLTPAIEAIEPYTLGVRIQNNGAGPAQNVKIDSAQPSIVENEQGLAIGFQIIGSSVDDIPTIPSLLIDFGQIDANRSKVGRWSMTSTLAGEFVAFSASFTHADELGGALTSLIAVTNAHLLLRDVRVDEPGRDSIRDFLASDAGVVRVYESDNIDTAVNDVSASAMLTLKTGSTTAHKLSFPVTPGLVYVKLPDPYAGSRNVTSVIRSDGKVIVLDNAWTSKTRNKTTTPNSWDYYVNFFDSNTTGSYIVDMSVQQIGPLAPVLQFIPNRTAAEGSQVSFIVEAADPNGDLPLITAAPLPVGATFVDNGAGAATFTWTPVVGQAGDHSITFTASDGTLSSYKAATIRVNPIGDTDADGIPDAWETSQYGNLNQNATSDFDGDGISDLDEYLLGSDPLSAFAPRMPMIQQPLDGFQVSSLLPALTVINTPDNGGAIVSYDFELYRDASMTDLATSTSALAEGVVSTSWQLASALSDNSWYYWRVRALGGGLYSPWVSGSFFVNTANDAPGAFNISYPLDLAQVDNITPVLEIDNSTDADQDALAYTFEVFADASFTTPITSSAAIAAGDGFTRWSVDVALSDATQYYWRVTATDNSGAQSQTNASFVVNLANNAPGVPVALGPVLNGLVTSLAVDLIAGNAADIEGGLLTYQFEIDTVNTFDSANKQVSPVVAETLGNTIWTPTGLTDNTLYYWRVKANDGLADSAWETSYFFINSVNDVPTAPVAHNPGERSWVASATPILSVQASTDADLEALRYEYEVYTDVDLSVTLAQVANQGTEWGASGLLPGIKLYYWRARAQDNTGAYSAWSTVNKFVRIDSAANNIPQVINPGTIDSLAGAVVSQQLVATDLDLNSLSYVASGLPEGLSINALSGLISGTVAVTAARDNNVTIFVSDGLDTVVSEFVWTIGGGNAAPVIMNPGTQTSVVGSVAALQITATDIDGDALSYTATGLPLSLTIDSVTGLIAGTLASNTAGSYVVTVSVSDGTVTSSASFTWAVNGAGTNQAPVITTPLNQAHTAGDNVSLTVAASDADGDALSFSATGLPTGLSIDTLSGVISGTIALTGAGSYNVSVSVSDGVATSSASFVWTVVNANQAPVVTTPADQFSAEGDTISLAIVASDADLHVLTYSALGLPSSLSINPTSGVIGGILSFVDAGSYNVTVSVNDGVVSRSVSFNWAVSNTNQAPQIIAPADVTYAEGVTVAMDILASDGDGDSLTYTAIGLPTSLTINLTTGSVAGTLLYTEAAIYNVTVTVSDGTTSSNTVFILTVTETNRAPLLSTIANQIIDVGTSATVTLSATDPDANSVAYSAIGLPTFASLLDNGDNTASLTLIPLAGDAGAYTLTITVTDNGLPALSASQVVNVVVNTATNQLPVVTNPGDQISVEGDTVSLTIVASDADGDSLVYSASGLPSGLSINTTSGVISGVVLAGAVSNYVSTVTASDGIGNSTVSFNWSVSPPAVPVGDLIPPGDLSGEIYADSYLDGEYIIPTGFTILSGATLTIKANSILKFAERAGLDVEGTLIIAGTASNPVTLTSTLATPVPASWHSIEFSGTSEGSVIDYAVIIGAETALDVEGSSVTIRNSLIQKYADVGVFMHDGAGGLIVDNVIDNDGTDNDDTHKDDTDKDDTHKDDTHKDDTHKDDTHKDDTDKDDTDKDDTDKDDTDKDDTDKDDTHKDDTHKDDIDSDGASGIILEDASATVSGYDLTISGNTIKNNVGGSGIRIVSESSPAINGGNQIINNKVGIWVIGSVVESIVTNPLVTGNSIYGNTLYDVSTEGYGINGASATLDFKGNWWGSVDAATIDTKIYDRNDDPQSPVVSITPVLTSAP